MDILINNSLNNAASQISKGHLDNKIAALKSGDNEAGSKLSPEKLAQIEDAAKEFEAVFISEMMKPMFSSVQVDEKFGGGKGEEIFSGMMVQEYGKMLAERGGLGISGQVKAELIRIQENAQ